MTEPRNVRNLPVGQLTDDELRQLLDAAAAEHAALVTNPTAGEALLKSIREKVRELEAEQRYRRETRNQEAMLSLSQGMLDVARSTLKVYEWLKWLTDVLALATIVQVAVAILKR